ncbi:hypothetical protein [Vallicoccus soli]|uniref:Uncharacterized protein n=1 Tax=Vallicoccus soli TaxID=2339232 RepID=A0A3A3Z5E9_9ACTN|nr:hypothetical protein [Vallicoccus soli]RJK98193.1 hypothetical protein D5H78_04645 [Vallicoccus soli]
MTMQAGRPTHRGPRGEDAPFALRAAFVLGPFGLLWGMVAASGAGGAAAALRVAAVVAAVLVVAGAVALARRRPPRPRSLPEGWHRRVGLVNAGQFVVIALVVVGCLVADAPQLVPPLVCLVVGVHFVPLARDFAQPEYRATAAGLCAAAVAGLVLLAAVDAEASRLVVGAVAALVLWGSALRVASRG